MKNNYVLMLLFVVKVFGQEITVKDSISKTNPILFIESFLGSGGGAKGGLFLISGTLNYQFNKKHLISARYVANSSFSNSYIETSPFTTFLTFAKTETQSEIGVLYGKRFINNNNSVSLSTGISFTGRNYYNEGKKIFDNYFGIPIEISVKWFKGKKTRFRAYYGFIPIGKKKVSFGRSVGIKLIGNFSRSGYIAFGFSYGFGWHKKY